MATKKVFLGLLIYFFSNLFVIGLTEFHVQGKLIRNEKGFKGIGLRIFPLDEDKLDDKNIITVITDSNGEFTFFCPAGQYEIEYLKDNGKNDDLVYIGPDGFQMPYKFSVNNRNLVFKKNIVAYTKLEIVEKSQIILTQSNPNLKYVSYKWGKIPVYSLDECRQEALEYLDMVKSMYGGISSVKKAYLGNPVVFYDLAGNAAYYQFPVMVGFIEVSYIGIHAIGAGPETYEFVIELVAETEEEIQSMINSGNKNKFTLDKNVPAAINVLSNKLGCLENDIHLEKLLYIYGGPVPVYALLKNIINNNYYALNLAYYHESTIAPLSLNESLLESQLDITFEYIMNCRYKKYPLF